MKNIKFLVLFIAIALINCERDDICAETTSTTPRLIIEFYDADDVEELKNVPRLTVYGEGVVTEPTEASDSIVLVYDDDDSYVFNVNTNKIALPLKIEDDLDNNFITTRFVLEKDTNLRLDDTGASNIDILEIRYDSKFVYVSRACGYKNTYVDLGLSRDLTDDSDTWISSIEIEETIENTVENENTTHVRIYH